MSGVLAGMSRKEAEALVAELRLACERIEGVDMLTSDFKKAYALAALGARCVGAKEHTEKRWGCPECGIGGRADEDRCCVTCGADCVEAECRVLVLEGE